MSAVHYCHIDREGIFLDGSLLFHSEDGENALKEYYRFSALDYPKFYKMDRLSKLAILAVTTLINNKVPFDKFGDAEIALVFANTRSSIDTDIKFKQSYEEQGNPGPSLFVYTLPNILTGELAISRKWYGENIFFISDNFDAELFSDQINSYFRKGNKAVLFGWVEAAGTDEYCFLFFIENTGEILTSEQLTTAYKEKKK